MDDTFLEEIRDAIRTVPNFPIDGIMFRDISPVLSRPGLLTKVTAQFVKDLDELGWKPDVIVGPEARGFIFGPLLAERLGIGFCLLYTSPSPRDVEESRMPSSA